MGLQQGWCVASSSLPGVPCCLLCLYPPCCQPLLAKVLFLPPSLFQPVEECQSTSFLQVRSAAWYNEKLSGCRAHWTHHVSNVIPRKTQAFMMKYWHFVRGLQHLKVSQADFSLSREFWAHCRQPKEQILLQSA